MFRFTAPSGRLAATAVLYALLATTTLARPEGVGTFTVPVLESAAPLPVGENYLAQAGIGPDGGEVNRYDPAVNPIIAILSGFDDIWTLGDDAWRSGGANGDGATDYSKVRIVDPAVWAANMAYVLDVTGPARTEAEALAAYLDDRRAQGYSVIEGMGPLLGAIYREQAGADTTVVETISSFDVLNPEQPKEDDQGTEAGDLASPLGDFVAFMQVMRGPEGTTSPAKYFYASPRPWRMTDTGEVIATGTEPFGEGIIETYDSNVAVIPALLSAREDRGRNKDGGFPSGHTNAAYLAAFAYAYALPERYEELLTRASELGENRIVTGMHSPLDVMGGRIMATAVAAAYLNDPAHAEVKAAAHANMQDVMSANLPEGLDLAAAAEIATDDRWADDAANASLFRQRLTYGFPQSQDGAGSEMVVPEGAEVLLETRLPYLDAEQRRVVLYTTGIGGGYPLVDDSHGWGRLDLVAAAGGYGAFPGDVNVTMDAERGGFHALDRWVHDIEGPGMLVKDGSGTLVLSGDNSYAGGTVLGAGTLLVEYATGLGTGDVLIEGGTLAVTTAGLTLGGELEITGGTLVVDAELASGDQLAAITAPTIVGAFERVETISGQPLETTVADGVLSVHLATN